MTAAIFGLLGVLAGGLLSGFVTWWLEQQRQRVETKAGARLTHIELGQARSAFDGARRSPDSFRDILKVLRTDAWEKHREALARVLDPEAWLAVSAAYAQIEFFREPHDWPEKARLLHTDDPRDLGYVRNMQKAMDALDLYGGGAYEYSPGARAASAKRRRITLGGAALFVVVFSVALSLGWLHLMTRKTVTREQAQVAVMKYARSSWARCVPSPTMSATWDCRAGETARKPQRPPVWYRAVAARDGSMTIRVSR